MSKDEYEFYLRKFNFERIQSHLENWEFLEEQRQIINKAGFHNSELELSYFNLVLNHAAKEFEFRESAN